MTDHDRLLRAIEAQEQLRGTLPDDVLDAALDALRAQLATTRATPVDEPRRRLATVLFADVAGFTAMSEHLDPEVVAELMNELWEVVDEAVIGHGGRVDKHIGDAVMGVWGVDGARDDDPDRAVRAALAVRDRFIAHRDRHQIDVDIRVGVNTGTVLYGLVGTVGEASVTGDAVNVASRIEHAAENGTVLISHDTFRHVRGNFDVTPMEPVRLKGKRDAVRTYVVHREKPRSFHLGFHGIEGLETSHVGRDAELGVLRQTFLDVESRRRSTILTILGDAGTGKSRLVHELTTWLDLRPETIRLLPGRAQPDRSVVPRSLLRDVFGDHLGVTEADTRDQAARKLRAGLVPLDERRADLTAHWLGFLRSDSAAVRDLIGSPDFGTVARAGLIEHVRELVRDVPLVMILDDAHWADSDSLAAVEHLVESLHDQPVLVLCVARPALLLDRPTWGDGPGHAPPMRLHDLSQDACRELVHEVLRLVADPSEGFVDDIVERCGGNPFHIEELVKMLIDDGTIVVGDDEWTLSTRQLHHATVPPTLAGVMQARLDALDAGPRRVVQVGSVIGRVFWDDALGAIHAAGGQRPTRGGVELDAALAELRRRELIRREPESTFSDCTEYAFKHALLRDATYETVLLGDRRALHTAAARWLEVRAGDRADEHLAQIAEHLVAAGAPDLAAVRFERIARQARDTGSLASAARAFQRMLELRELAGLDDDAATIDARVELGSICADLGRYDEARAALDAASDTVERGANPGSPADVVNVRAALLWLAALRGEWHEAVELVERTRPLLADATDAPRARFLSAEALLLQNGPDSDIERSLVVAAEALDLWRRLDDNVNAAAAINRLGIGCSRLHRFDEASRWYDEGLELARGIGNTRYEATLLLNAAAQAHVRARLTGGTYDEVIHLYRACVDRFRRLSLYMSTPLVNLSQAEIEDGWLEDGAGHLVEACQHALRARSQADLSFCLIVHGQLRLARGQVDAGLGVIATVLNELGTPELIAEAEDAIAVHGRPAGAWREIPVPAERSFRAHVADVLAEADESWSYGVDDLDFFPDGGGRRRLTDQTPP